MVYKYKWRATAYPVPAQQAGEYLQKISDKENGITSERLLELSRDEDALMHKCFEWDDTKAAEKYRLKQAHDIIINIVAVEIDEQPVEKTRAFVSVTATAHAEKGIFKPLITALSTDHEKEIVLQNALRDWEIFKEKYKNLDALAHSIEAFDSALNG